MKSLPADLLDRPAPEGARWLALAALDALVRTRPRLDDRRDAEALHDFRVALLKLRTALRAYRGVLRRSVPRSVRRHLSALAVAAGAYRDAEVRLHWVRERRVRHGSVGMPGIAWVGRRVRREQRAAEREFRRHVRRDFRGITQRLRRTLGKYEVALRAGKPWAMPATRTLVARTILAMTSDLRAALAKPTRAADARALHRARIAAKRLRYVIEPLARGGVASAPLAATAENAVVQLAWLQDALGRLNDAHVFRRWLRAALRDASTPAAVNADVRALQRLFVNEAKANYDIVRRPESRRRVTLMLRALRAAVRDMMPQGVDGARFSP